MAKHGKSYLEAREKVDREREYTPAEAVKLVKELKSAKFDESVEVHVRTGLNVRHADEQLRGTIALPHGLGKDVTIAVFARGDKAARPRRPAPTSSAPRTSPSASRTRLHRLRRRHRDAGHDARRRPPRPHPRPAGQDAEPEGRHGHDGRRARPSRSPRPARSSTAPTAPRSSTWSVGKTSFQDEQLLENYQAVIEELIRAKPSAAKGRYIRSIVMASTHGARASRSTRSQTKDLTESAGGGRRGLGRRQAGDRSSFHRPRRAAPRREARARRNAVNRDQKAAVIDEVAGQIQEAEAHLRGRLPRHLGAAGRRAAHAAARGRRLVPGRQEHAHRARRRPGGRRGAQGLPRGPDGDDVRARRRRRGRQGARATSAAPPACSPSRAAG